MPSAKECHYEGSDQRANKDDQRYVERMIHHKLSIQRMPGELKGKAMETSGKLLVPSVPSPWVLLARTGR